MKKTALLRFSLLAACAAGAFQSSFGVVTEPVGGVNVNCPNGSDTILSLPFHGSPAFSGVVSSVSSNTITIGGTPGFTVDEFVSSTSHYALVFSGALEGLVLPITANTTDTLTVTTGGVDISTIVADDQLRIIPFCTLADLIPNTAPNGLKLFPFNMDSAGENVSASAIYEHFQTFGWYDGGTFVGDYVLYPGEAFIIRNQSGSDYSLTFYGNVLACSQRTQIHTLSGGLNQDNHIGLAVPVDVMIGDLNLGLETNDKLFIYDNSQVAINKSPIRIIEYFDTFGWYDGGTRVDNPADPGNQLYLKAGQGYVFRKKSSVSPTSFTWTYTPNYLPF